LPSFNDFIQITNAALPHSLRQWAIYPRSLIPFKDKSAHQIAGTGVLITGNSPHRQLQLLRHVLDKPCFSTSGRSFDEQRKMMVESLSKNQLFVT
jgi:hypothetical protein